MERILVVEDADSLREVLEVVLEAEGYEVDSFRSAEKAEEAIRTKNYSCILADFKLPGKNGIELLKFTREVSNTVPFLIMTAFGSIEIATEAMKLGANDFICKPFDPQEFCSVIREIIDHRQVIDRNLGTKTRRLRSFITRDSDTEHLLHQARKVARVDTSVLVLGESGTGKELIARYIHEHSPRSDKPFVAVNCGAMPAELLESEFFGHEEGAFTGATQQRIGVFEYASEGTIFLDEIGDMPLPLQVKLLRALQEREIKRIGSNKVIAACPRVIAATNHNVEELLEQGKMRDDFYYRIAVVTLNIKSLRERNSDIELLAEYYLDYFAKKLGRPDVVFAQEAIDVLKSYSWPGNARELENVIERALILADDTLRPEHLGINLHVDFDALEEVATTLPEIAQRAMRRAEIDLITRTLAKTAGNKTKAAELLGVSYKTLLNKVKDYEIEVPR